MPENAKATRPLWIATGTAKEVPTSTSAPENALVSETYTVQTDKSPYSFLFSLQSNEMTLSTGLSR